jgi:hypothetical protein
MPEMADKFALVLHVLVCLSVEIVIYLIKKMFQSYDYTICTLHEGRINKIIGSRGFTSTA